MAFDPLPSLPDRSSVFIDPNVFLHALTAQSAQCRQLLERCLREEVTGFALFETVDEVTCHARQNNGALEKGGSRWNHGGAGAGK